MGECQRMASERVLKATMIPPMMVCVEFVVSRAYKLESKPCLLCRPQETSNFFQNGILLEPPFLRWDHRLQLVIAHLRLTLQNLPVKSQNQNYDNIGSYVLYIILCCKRCWFPR